MNSVNQQIRSQAGVGLIEVMVALILLSVGFLAVANMQIQSMRSNQNSNHRAQALLLISDMMDRMRNNPQGVANGSYDDRSTGTMTLPECISTGCNATQMAGLDMYEWSANLIPLRGETHFVPVLPGADATHPATGSVSAPVSGVYTITMNWTGFVDGQTSAESVSVRFEP